jgi:hypothetical protein
MDGGKIRGVDAREVEPAQLGAEAGRERHEVEGSGLAHLRHLQTTSLADRDKKARAGPCIHVMADGGPIPGSTIPHSPGSAPPSETLCLVAPGRTLAHDDFVTTGLGPIMTISVSIREHLESLESFVIRWRPSDSQEPLGVDERKPRSL